MTKRILGVAMVLALCAPVFAQGPKAKSQEEIDALIAIEGATDADTRIGAIHTLLTNFKDTESSTRSAQPPVPRCWILASACIVAI